MGMRPLEPNDIKGSILPSSIAIPEIDDPNAPSGVGAAFRQEFAPASASAFWSNYPGPSTPAEAEKYRLGEYDYESYIPEDLVDYSSEYAKYATNPRQAAWVTENLRQQLRDREAVDKAGAVGFIASSFAAMTSPEQWPTYFIPGAAILKPAVLTGSRASLVAAEAGIAATGAAVGEYTLHQTQGTRTAEESAYAIAGSALFAGLLTGGIVTAKGVGRSAQEFAADLDADLRLMDGDVRADELNARNMGAAEAHADVYATHRSLLEEAEADVRAASDAGNIEGMTRAQAKVDKLKAMPPETLSQLKHPKLAKALGWASPAVRLAGARVSAVRELSAMLVDDPMTRVRNQFGDTLPPSIESQMSNFEQEMGHKVLGVMDTSYAAYKKAAKASGEVAMVREEFSKMVSKAMRNGDESPNEFVGQVAKILRKEVADPIQTRLDTQDMLDRRVTNWEVLTPEDLDGFVEPELIPQFFKADGSPKGSIKSIPAEARDNLVQTGKLQTEIRVPPGDKSYLHRLWDFEAIKEQPDVFRRRVAEYFYQQSEREIRKTTIEKVEGTLAAVTEKEAKVSAKVAKSKKKGKVVERTYEQRKAELDTMTPEERKRHRRTDAQRAYDLAEEARYLREVEMPRAKAKYDAELVVARRISDNAADEVMSNILSKQYQPTMGRDRVSFKEGPLKDRTLVIPTHIVEDFVDNDIENILGHYVRDINAPLHFKETFDPSAEGSIKVNADPQDTGIKAFEAKMEETRALYTQLEKDAYAAGDRKKAKSIAKEWDKVKRDMSAMQEVLFNKYKMPDNPDGFWYKAAQRLKEFNIMTMLGMVTVSSVPDIGNYIARRGLGTFARDMTRLATNMKAVKMSMRMARVAGMSADLMNSSRLEKLYMMDDIQAPIGHTKAGKAWENTRTVFTKATGMPYWNNFWKSMTATSYIDDVASDALRAVRGELDDVAIEAYAKGNLSLADLKAIGRSLNESRDMVDGVWVPQIEEWADQALAQRFKAAVRKEVDMTVVTPGKGDLPLASRSEVGKLVFQFKSFSMAANNRILMAGLDDFTASRVAGTMAMVVLGYTSYTARETLKGNDVKTDYDTFIREGIDRSGLLAYWGELNAMLSKATAGEGDIYRLLGADKGELSRYASRNLLGAIMGVSAGRIADIGQITSAIAKGDFSESDIRAIRRAVIFNNLWATHRGFTQIEKAVGG